MSHIVCEPCNNCKYTDCVAVCPVECFHEAETMLYIDPDECIDCALCIPECPVEAIFADSDVPEKWQSYIELNAKMAPTLPVINAQKDPLPTAPPRPHKG
jgi:ferredoxin